MAKAKVQSSLSSLSSWSLQSSLRLLSLRSLGAGGWRDLEINGDIMEMYLRLETGGCRPSTTAGDGKTWRDDSYATRMIRLEAQVS
jgi:hypothetical protein